MKKQLLLGSALLATVAVNAQTNKAKPFQSAYSQKLFPTKYITKVNQDGKTFVDESFYSIPLKENSTNEKAVAQPTVNWNKISGSMNVYGLLVSESKPLLYNPTIDAISFVHRKSPTYVSSPANNSGSMVAMLTNNWGNSWDSTCIWADGTNLARYPQGGLYSAPGNTNYANAYVVGSGPVTDGSSWIGNWYASKSVNATPKNQPGPDMQFISETTTSTVFPKHSFSRYGFTSTNDGFVRSVGDLAEDDDATSFAARKYRGAWIAKGTFNAGVFVWSGDSIIPSTLLRTDGAKAVQAQANMAWNQAGTVGYCVFIGSKQGATGTNIGAQPIIHKTTNSGASWAPVNGIDFNNSSFNPIKASLPAIWSSTTANTASIIPNFWSNEGFALTVDKDNKLHIFTVVQGSARTAADSAGIGYSFSLSVNPGDEYSWGHVPGNRPYLYDFIGDGTTNWTYKLVDSMSTEGMSGTSGEPGFNDNPWNTDGNGSKVDINARMQLSRTPCGDGIVYSWTESDTNSTNGAKKYNNKPNLKVRVGYFSGSNYTISNTEWNLTSPPVNTGQGAVNAKAWFHYQSAVSSAFTSTGITNTLKVPFTISNSSPLDQLGGNTHYYTTANIDFNAPVINVCGTIVGINENAELNTINNVSVYPNPASNNAFVNVNLKEASNVTINVVNTLGQVVSTATEQANTGANTINVNLNGVSTGIYFVNVKAGNQTSTAKLIVE